MHREVRTLFPVALIKVQKYVGKTLPVPDQRDQMQLICNVRTFEYTAQHIDSAGLARVFDVQRQQKNKQAVATAVTTDKQSK